MPKVVASTAAIEVLLTMVAAKISSDYLGVASLICLLPCLLALNIVVIRFVWRHCYRPPENHLGVVYRFGRFRNFVEPDNWTFLLPKIDRVHREISLYMRTADLQLAKVELLDGLTVDVRLKVFFMVDVRLASPGNFVQVMKFEGPEWTEMIKTSAEDIVRNQVFLQSTYAEILVQRKNVEIKKRISQDLSHRMRGFGIIINEDRGAMPINIQPSSTYIKAVQASRAATPLGEAALERLRPVLGALSQIKHEDARTTLLLELASKIVEVDNLPDIMLSPTELHSSDYDRETRKILKGDPDGYSRQIKPRDKNYPLAG